MVTAYTAAQFNALGKAFNSFLGMNHVTGIFIAAGFILFYTSVGGLKAVAYSDLVQGVLMFLGLLVLLVAPRLTSAANADREPALRDGLARMRTQIAIYQCEHHGVAPGYPNGNTTMMPTHEAFMDQLTRYSNAQGFTSDTSSEEFKFGPYITSIPINPLQKSTDIRFVPPLERNPSASGEQDWIYQPMTGWMAANSPGTDIFNVSYTDY